MNMCTITPRIPEIDWHRDFARHWNGNNAAATHAFNALSFLFPQGERMFIAVAREVSKELNLENNQELAKAIQAFTTQEAIHTAQHEQYNAILNQQGFENVVHDYIEWIQSLAYRYTTPLTRLAIVCAYEHYTAVLGHFLLHHPQAVAKAPPSLALVWGWHAAEETEHKAVCFDLYRAAGGGWLRRASLFLLVSFEFSIIFSRLYASMLYRDGCFHWRRLFTTFRQMGSFFFGGNGVMWTLLPHASHYLGPRFHPWKQDDRRLLTEWLQRNRTKLREIPTAERTG